jgi:hypothetical protein
VPDDASISCNRHEARRLRFAQRPGDSLVQMCTRTTAPLIGRELSKFSRVSPFFHEFLLQLKMNRATANTSFSVHKHYLGQKVGRSRK